MIKLKKIIHVIFWAAFFLSLASAQLNAQDAAIRGRYNEAIEAIVKEIIQSKQGYPELEGFSSSAIRPNSNGFNSVSYKHDFSGGDQDPYDFNFSIDIKELDGDESQGNDSSWDIKFPLLSFKVSIKSQKKGESTSFDIRKIIESNLEHLRILEQDHLPFRLELKAQQGAYSVYENITIIASLKNMGLKAFKVADLDENSLSCKIGNKDWGNTEAALELNKVLNANGTITKMLEVKGVDSVQELSISCTYGISYKGVQPYNRIKVFIHPRS